MTEKKPDLSDLKARLGLNKPGAAPPPGAKSGPPGPQAAPAPQQPAPVSSASPGPPLGAQAPVQASYPPAPQPASYPPAPQASAPPAAFPPTSGPPHSSAPPTAGGPPQGFAPPSAAPAPVKAKPAKKAPAPAPSSMSADIAIGNDIDAAPVFSKGVILLFGICLVVGIVFGWAFSTSMYTNQMDSARSADAETLLNVVTPKVAAFKEVMPKIGALSETAPDFEAVKSLGTDFVLDGNPLGGGRLLIGQAAIDAVTTYAIETQLFLTILREHDRLTKADQEELEQLAQDNKILENDFFGVTFDYVHALKFGGESNYVPKEGRLVVSRGASEEDPTKLKVETAGTGQVTEVPVQAYIPIGKSQIVRSAGQNALTRYQARIRQIKFQATKIEKTLDSVTTALQAVVEGA